MRFEMCEHRLISFKWPETRTMSFLAQFLTTGFGACGPRHRGALMLRLSVARSLSQRRSSLG